MKKQRKMSSLLFNLLTDSAQLHPEKTAIRYKAEKISYKTLNLLSSHVAASLINKGVKTSDKVGVYIDKSIDAVIAIFGILKSGACYVPLDPVAPPSRESLLINDCKLKYLIVSSKKFPQIRQILQKENSLKYLFVVDIARNKCKESIAGVNVVFKDEILESDIDVSKQRMEAIKDDTLAYIFYTSGSTGQPKGVMISHKASLSFVDWSCECFNVNSDDNISSHAPFHFDLSIFDIFVTIRAGATMCIVPQGLSAFPKSLADFIENEKISIWYSVPSVLIQLLLYGVLEERNLLSLKQILFAGEVFPTKYLRKLIEMIPHAKYYNLYGPTETNVCTYYPVESLLASDDSIPIGKPYDGQECFIVDDAGNLIEDGRIGELYVSGPTLMEGYWNDFQKTKNVLFKNPFCSENKKVYRTGDMVNVNKDKDFEYHGRRDGMIKSRGYRIELGEIESVLSRHPEIKEVAAIGVPDEETGKQIKAVIVLREDSIISDKEIKLFCSKNLPLYMVPQTIVFRDCFPRTSTNKVDRKKLEKELI